MANNVRFTASVDDKVSGTLAKIRDRFDQLGKGAASASLVGNVGAKLLAGGLGLVSQAGSVAINVIEDSIKNASDLNETLQKSGVVFGSSAGEIKKFGETAAQSMGLSENAAIAAAASIGNLLLSTGTAKEKIAPMSEGIVKLASDLASFNNIPIEDALAKLQSGLVGQERPLRALGVAISAASVDSEALALGFKKVNGVFTEGQKVQARYSLIFKQTGTAQGDFARTSDQLANEQRIVAAEVENASAQLGTKLLPIVLQVERAIANDLMPAVSQLIDLMGKSGDAATQFAGALDTIAGVNKEAAASSDFLGDKTSTLGKAVHSAADMVSDYLVYMGFVPAASKAVTDATEKLDGAVVSVTGAWGDLTPVVQAASKGSERAVDQLAKAGRDDADKVVLSYYDIAAAARTTASKIATESGKMIKYADLVTKRYVDDATATLRGYFDPIEERWALHETRVGLAVDQQKLHIAKGKEAQGAASAAIVQDLDNEYGQLVTLGSQHKLTAKDVANFAKDAKANYKSLGKDGRHEVDAMVAKLRTLAGLPDISMKFTLLAKVEGSGGAIGVGGHVSGHGMLIYDKGGTVPGPVGAPQLAIVHGGEVVVPTGGMQLAGSGMSTSSSTTINFTYAPATSTASAAEAQQFSRSILPEFIREARRQKLIA